jgi:hypothetical protein
VTTHALTRPLPRVLRSTAFVAAASALAGGLAILALIGVVRLLGGSNEQQSAHTYAAPDHAFSIAVPEGWTALPGTQVAKVPGNPAAVLRRGDGRGLLVIRRSAAVQGDLRAVARTLTADLSRRFAGFRLVSARLGRVRAGGAFLYTFVRGARGTVQSLALTRIGGNTYRIDSVVSGDAPDVARQTGAIVASFGP